MTDSQLLHQYATAGDQAAFAELVRQHVDVVYSAARRQARGDAHLAEEITQQTFILLAQKAKTLGDEVLIGGWLYNTVRFIARDILRKEERRDFHEQKAAAMADELRNAAAPGAKADAWSDAEEILDEAMNGLDEPTRGLLVLRYFEGKTAGEVGARLGITEEAARKRISRAVDQLRNLFAGKGVTMTSAALAETVLAKAIIHAPAHLAALTASAATTTAAIASATATATTLTKTGTILMAASKTQLITAAIVSAICVTGAVVGGVKAVQYFSSAEPTNPGASRTVRVAPAGPTLTGIIRDPAGKPLAGAEVLICSQGRSLNIYGNNANAATLRLAAQAVLVAPTAPPPLVSRPIATGRGTFTPASTTSPSAITIRTPQAPAMPMLILPSAPPPTGNNITGPDGHFTLAHTDGHFELIVRSPQGFAQVSSETLAKSPDVTIAPWGTIAGRVMQGTKPLANAQLYTFEQPAPYGMTTIMRQKQFRTDADGNFALSQIAPGEIKLALKDPATGRFSRWAYGVVDPGKTTTINIGGTGKPITGKFVAEPTTAPTSQPLVWDYKSKKFAPSAYLRHTGFLAVQRPNHPSGETLEEYRATEEAFGKTPEGAQFKADENGSIEFFVNPDGTFRIDDVPAGDYNLSGVIMQLDAGINYTEDIARSQFKFTVDPMPSGRSDNAQDIGPVEMKFSHFLHAGDEATPFQFTTADGTSHSITDYRGKHLLIILCGPFDWIKPLIDPFKPIADQYKNNPRIQIVWLVLATPEEAPKAATDLQLPGLIANCLNSDVPTEYAATIPAGILIDPAGKLIEKHMMDPTVVTKVVHKALSVLK